jgi:hypothetical protein
MNKIDFDVTIIGIYKEMNLSHSIKTTIMSLYERQLEILSNLYIMDTEGNLKMCTLCAIALDIQVFKLYAIIVKILTIIVLYRLS